MPVGFRAEIQVDVFGFAVGQVALHLSDHASDGLDRVGPDFLVLDVVQQLCESGDPENFGLDGVFVEVERETADEAVCGAEAAVEHAALVERGLP